MYVCSYLVKKCIIITELREFQTSTLKMCISDDFGSFYGPWIRIRICIFLLDPDPHIYNESGSGKKKICLIFTITNPKIFNSMEVIGPIIC